MVQEILTAKEEHRPEHLFFLDRSARPDAWLFREIWQQTSKGMPMPQIKFINIGKEKAPNFEGEYADEQAQGKFKDKLQRSRYVTQLQETFPKDLEGANIWVVDEFKQEGTSAMIATTLLEAAFMSKGGNVRTHVLHSVEPPWHRKESRIGVRENDPKDLFVRPLEDNLGLDMIVVEDDDGSIHIEYEENPNVSLQLRKEIHELVLDNVIYDLM